MMDLATAARSVSGRVQGHNVIFQRVITDSRSLVRGDLFVALAGERFDGHDFVPAVLTAGAAAAMVAQARAGALPGPLLVVDDPLAALGRLAAAWREHFVLPVCLIVGSNGKTTVKEMTAAALSAHFGAEHVLATHGNLNNAIGLPLTLLRLSDAHRAAVVELGMNHRGETGALAPLAAPSVVVVNNAQREHLEFMQSVADVAAEHADAVRCVAPGGHAVLNADDTQCAVWEAAAEERGARVVRFGLAADADVRADVVLRADGSRLALTTPSGRAELALGVPGEPMARNALAACAAALAAGADLAAVVRGLEAFRAVPGRLALRTGARGVTVIDDSYNANPDSVRAAIDVLARADGERWLVLGDMGEVGESGPEFHREIGAYAALAGIERLLASGPLAAHASAAFGGGATHFDDVARLTAAVMEEAAPGVTVLVKGSRFMGMERVVAALCGEGPKGH